MEIIEPLTQDEIAVLQSTSIHIPDKEIKSKNLSAYCAKCSIFLDIASANIKTFQAAKQKVDTHALAKGPEHNPFIVIGSELVYEAIKYKTMSSLTGKNIKNNGYNKP